MLQAITERKNAQLIDWYNELPLPQTPAEEAIEDAIVNYIMSEGLDNEL